MWLLLLPLATRAQTPVTPSFSGTVSDSVGNLLSNVELLIVDSASTSKPLATARTDELGRFRFGKFPPGVYRLAALKQGYVTFVGEVDTDAKSWLQIVLRPTAGIAAERERTLPEDASWVFRLPRRYVLHDRDPEPFDSDPSSIAESGSDAPVRMQVDQLFAMPVDGSGTATGRPEVRGTETQLKLASSLGSHGELDVRGVHRQIGSRRADPTAAEADRETGAMSVAFGYAPSAESNVAFNAFYGRRAVGYDPTGSGSATGEPGRGRRDRSRRHWGYDASWSTRLDPDRSLQVELDYLDTMLAADDPGTAASPFSGETTVSARTVGARGSYAHTPVADHEVRVGVHAQRLDATSTIAPGMVPAVETGFGGWNLGVDVDDTWSVTRPLSISYGVGYRHLAGPRDAALLVPRVGAGWLMDRVRLLGSLAYYGVSAPASVRLSRSEAPALTSEQPWGYEAVVEVPIGERLQLAAATSLTPFHAEAWGYARGDRAAGQPIFVTDGEVSVQEHRVSLQQRSRTMRAFIEYTSGLAEGRLTPVMLGATPTSLLDERRMEYGAGRFGIFIEPSGTDVSLQYRTLFSLPETASAEGEAREESLELRVTQQLLQGWPVGNWRVLMALRRATLSGLLGETGDHADAELLESLDHQLSAGLSVTF